MRFLALTASGVNRVGCSNPWEGGELILGQGVIWVGLSLASTDAGTPASWTSVANPTKLKHRLPAAMMDPLPMPHSGSPQPWLMIPHW